METIFAIMKTIFSVLSAYFGLKFIGHSDMENDYYWAFTAIILGIWSL